MILELAVAILVLDRIYQGGRQVYLQYKAEERARGLFTGRPAQYVSRVEAGYTPTQWVDPNNQSKPD